MKSCLFGLNKRQVDNYIADVKSSHNETAEKLIQSINSASEESKRLLAELDKLLEEKKILDKEKSLIDMARKRLDETNAHISGLAEEEAAEIRRTSDEKISGIEEKIKKELDEINNIERQISSLVLNITELLKKAEDSENKDQEPIKESDENTDESEEEESSSKFSLKVIPYKAKISSSEPVKNSPKQKEDSVQKEPKQKKEVSDESFFEQENWDMTADGTTVNKTESTHTELDYNKPRKKAADKHKKTRELSWKTDEDSFWGYEPDEPAAAVRVKKASSQIIKEKNISTSAVEEAAPVSELKIAEKQQEPNHCNSQESSEHMKVKSACSENRNGEQAAPSRKSTAVSEEINSLRYKYIVGKVAGETLLDSEGKTIVSKNTTITVDVIEKAEQEGKLSELIMNMLIAGME